MTVLQPTSFIEKHILVVDDEPSLVKFLSKSLQRLGNEYVIDTAQDPHEALEKIEQNRYQLLLTDYMMPRMTGLDLIQAAREVSPGMEYVLMTAHNTELLRREIGESEISGYIAKPFTTSQIRELVQRGIERIQPQVELPESSQAEMQVIGLQLKELQANTGAQCVLLLRNDGHVIQVVGQTSGINREKVASLVAANFLVATELTSLLGNHSDFKSSYQEGSKHDIYAYAVNKNWLLAVVFDARIKPGVVWFYTKQVAESLLPLAEQAADEVAQPNQALIEQFVDDISYNGVRPAKTDPASPLNPDAKTETQVETETNHTTEFSDEPRAAEPSEPDQTTSQGSKKQRKKRKYKRLSFEEAVEAGLVPHHILSREETSS